MVIRQEPYLISNIIIIISQNKSSEFRLLFLQYFFVLYTYRLGHDILFFLFFNRVELFFKFLEITFQVS